MDKPLELAPDILTEEIPAQLSREQRPRFCWLGNYSLTDPNADISYLVVGGADSERSIAEITFNRVNPAPEPSDWTLLAGGLVFFFVLRARQLKLKGNYG